MATTTKEPLPIDPMASLAQAGRLDARIAPEQPASRADAIGVEVPVVVHAARHHVTDRGTGQALPPLHEEAHTTIVFPQGAVVRLSAILLVGELVVLTNRQSGADALCRVINIKTHPGIQNYVDLEFTQRTPGFWKQAIASQSVVSQSVAGQTVPEERPVRTETSATAPATPIAAKAPAIALPVQQLASPSPSKTAPVLPVPAASFDFAQPAPVSTPVPDIAPLSPQNVSETSATLLPVHSAQPEHFTDAEVQQDEAPPIPAILQKALWATAAAVVVVVLTAGSFLLGRRGRPGSPAASASQIALAFPSVPIQSVASTRASQSPVSYAASAAAGRVTPALSPTSIEEPASSLRPDEDPANSPPPLLRRSVIRVEKLTSPISNTQTNAASIDPPPVVQARGNNVADNMLATGLLSGARANVPAPSVAAASDGQIEAPKLISALSPVYPSFARQMNVHGVVVIDALVDATGKVSTATVVSGPAALQQAAKEAVLNARYQPARLNGQATSVHTTVDITFTGTAENGVTARSGANLADNTHDIGASSGASVPSAQPSVAATPGAQNEPPKLITSLSPVYPSYARQMNIQGVVVIDALVDATGKVASATVVSGPTALQQAAREAVLNSRYRPARLNGQAISTHTTVDITFTGR